MKHVDISDQRVSKMPVIECGEKLVSVTGFINVGTPPESLLTQRNYTLLREGVLARLLEAQSKLPAGLKFRLYEGYRSPSFQKVLFQEQLDREKKAAPNASKFECYESAARLVAPTETYCGKSLCPPHSTGGALDIEIVDLSNQVINSGMEIKDWNKVESDFCASDFHSISSEARQNRSMLIAIMSEVGFVNYSREWWHFSYGDRYWAYIKGMRHGIYDAIDTEDA